MKNKPPRDALLKSFYQSYLVNQDSAALIKRVSQRYTIGTLERLAESAASRHPPRRRAGAGLRRRLCVERRAGPRLTDRDRGVRSLAENGIRAIWCRAGNDAQRQQLAVVIRANTAGQYDEATVRATELIEEAPWFAEAWNQRAIANFGAKRFAESIRDCHQALELNPYHFGAAAGMGQCYLQLGNPGSALECFRRALRLNGDLEGVRASVTRLERAQRKKP